MAAAHATTPRRRPLPAAAGTARTTHAVAVVRIELVVELVGVLVSVLVSVLVGGAGARDPSRGVCIQRPARAPVRHGTRAARSQARRGARYGASPGRRVCAALVVAGAPAAPTSVAGAGGALGGSGDPLGSSSGAFGDGSGGWRAYRRAHSAAGPRAAGGLGGAAELVQSRVHEFRGEGALAQPSAPLRPSALTAGDVPGRLPRWNGCVRRRRALIVPRLHHHGTLRPFLTRRMCWQPSRLEQARRHWTCPTRAASSGARSCPRTRAGAAVDRALGGDAGGHAGG